MLEQLRLNPNVNLTTPASISVRDRVIENHFRAGTKLADECMDGFLEFFSCFNLSPRILHPFELVNRWAMASYWVIKSKDSRRSKT